MEGGMVDDSEEQQRRVLGEDLKDWAETAGSVIFGRWKDKLWQSKVCLRMRCGNCEVQAVERQSLAVERLLKEKIKGAGLRVFDFAREVKRLRPFRKINCRVL